MNKPTADDIKQAIAYSGKWLNLLDDGWLCWCCRLYDPNGDQVIWGDDAPDDDCCALTPEQAMAQCWVRYHAPIPPILPGSVPLEVPDGWRFELSPPMTDYELGFDLEAEREERLRELRDELGPKH